MLSKDPIGKGLQIFGIVLIGGSFLALGISIVMQLMH
jgi:hypothetical protein